MKVLVADDSAMIRKLIARAVTTADGLDAELVEASDGVEVGAVMRKGETDA